MTSRRQTRSGQRRQAVRPILEALENRLCPAVTFAFDLGVLHVTGDAGPNVIKVFQPRDHVVEVIGDGVTQTFDGVNEVLINTLDGNDEVSSSKPKEIVVVGSKINVNAGAGNDRIRIDDGGFTRRPAIFSTPLEAKVDLGTGIDFLSVQVHHHDDVHLEVLSSDGDDGVAVGLLLPAVQKIREAVARTSINVGAGGNLVDVRADNFENVELSIEATLPTSTESRQSANGDNINVLLSGMDAPAVRRGNWVLDISLAGTNDNVAIEGRSNANQHPDFLWFPSRISAAIDLGAGNDRFSFETHGLPAVQLNLLAGDGDDQADVLLASNRLFVGGLSMDTSADLGQGNDSLRLFSSGYSNVELNIKAGEGDDAVEADTARPGVGFLRSIDGGSTWSLNMDLGEGDDLAIVDSTGFSNVVSDIKAGSGNDQVAQKHWSASNFRFNVGDLPSIEQRVDLGAGNDKLLLDSTGYGNVSNFVDAGSGDDAAQIRYRSFFLVDRTNLKSEVHMGLGIDSCLLDTVGYNDISAKFNTGPAADGNDTVLVSFLMLPPFGGVQRLNRVFDGGLDSLDLRAIGYEPITILPSPIEGPEFTITAIIHPAAS